jgi:hypothetical protein
MAKIVKNPDSSFPMRDLTSLLPRLNTRGIYIINYRGIKTLFGENGITLTETPDTLTFSGNEVFLVEDLEELEGLTGMKEGDTALIADAESGNRGISFYDGENWTDPFIEGGGGEGTDGNGIFTLSNDGETVAIASALLAADLTWSTSTNAFIVSGARGVQTGVIEANNSAASGSAVKGTALTGIGVRGITSSTTGVQGEAGTGAGVRGNSSSGIGVYGQSVSNVAVQGSSGVVAGLFVRNDDTTDAVSRVVEIHKSTTGTAAAGMGGGLHWALEQDGGTNAQVGGIDMVLTDPTTGSSVARLDINVKNGATVLRKLGIEGSGQITFDTYGVNTHVGTAAKLLAVTSAGVVIEEDLAEVLDPTDDSITSFNATIHSVAYNTPLKKLLYTYAMTASSFIEISNVIPDIAVNGDNVPVYISITGSGATVGATTTNRRTYPVTPGTATGGGVTYDYVYYDDPNLLYRINNNIAENLQLTLVIEYLPT